MASERTLIAVVLLIGLLSFGFMLIGTGTIEFSDITGRSVEETAINEAPIALAAELSTAQDTPLTVDLSEYFSDPENQELTFLAAEEDVVAVSIDGNIATFLPAQGFAGERTLTIIATDGENIVRTPVKLTVGEGVSVPETVSEPVAQEESEQAAAPEEPAPPPEESSGGFGGQGFTTQDTCGSCAGCTTCMATDGTLCSLTADITSTDTCVVVTGSNTELNCSGFSISFNSDAGDRETGIFIENTSGVTIKDCIIRDTNSAGFFGVGVNASNSSNILFLNNTVLTNNSAANTMGYIQVIGNGSIIANNTIYTNTTGEGIVLMHSSNTDVRNNTIATNNGIGIESFTNTNNNNTFTYNVIRTAGTSGIKMGIRLIGGNSSRIISNTIVTGPNSNDNDGISISGAFHSIINNTVNVSGVLFNDGIAANAFFSNYTNNNITTNGAGFARNPGIRMGSLLTLASRFESNEISTVANESYAIDISAGNGSEFINTVMADPIHWINSSANTINNFTNTTFLTKHGSVNYPQRLTITGTTSINRQKFNVSPNNVFLNSTALSILNTSAQITLRGITTFNPDPIVDFDDDGMFEDCPGSICEEISFSNGVYVYNVTQFSSYSSSSGNLSACATINESATLTQNLISNDTCITMGADNITLDCLGLSISYNANGGNQEFGVSVTGRTNITIRDCVIRDINSTGEFGIAINFSQTNSSFIINNTLLTNGTSEGYGIEIELNSNNNTVRNNKINTSGSSGINYGMLLFNLTSDNNITGNIIRTNGTSSNIGIRLNTNANNNIISHNNITANGSSINNQGIFFFDTNSGNNITGNIIRTSGTSTNAGILIQTTANNNHVSNNHINTSGSSSNNYGVYLFSAASNSTIIGNTISTAGTGLNNGIRLETTSNNNIVSSNNITTSGSSNNNHGIYLFSTAANNNITDNTINTGGTSTNMGIRLQTRANNNLVDKNNITTTGTDSYGIQILISNSTMFNNTIFNNPVQWITQDSNSFNNFTNTTFEMPNGSIRIIPITQANGTQNVTKSRLNITSNNAFLNSTAFPFFNTTAQITLNGITFSNPEPIVDFNDDDSFETCPTTICEEVSFSSNVFIYNVTQFTQFSSQETTINLSTGGVTINESTTLTEPINANDTGIIIGSDNLTLDCAGFSILYNSDGGDRESGVLAVGRTNITVVDCVIRDINLTGSFGIAVNFTSVNASNVYNNTIFTNGTNRNYGVLIQTNSENNNISENIIRTKGSSSTNYGIILSSTASRNNVTGNLIFTNGTNNNYGVFLTSTANNNIVSENRIVTNGSTGSNVGIYLFSFASLNNITRNNMTTDSQASGGNAGIDVEANSNYNFVSYNFINTSGIGNTNVGVRLEDTVAGTNVTNNVIQTHSRLLGDAYGIYIFNEVHNNSIVGNTITTTSFGDADRNWGVNLFATVTGNNVTHNRISVNGTNNNQGVLFQSNADYNTINFNNVTTNGNGSDNFGIFMLDTNIGNNLTGNIIITNGSRDNHGIMLRNDNRDNNFEFNNISTYGNTSYGVALTNANNTFNGNRLNNTVEWINSSAGNLNNFTNTTFEMPDGSINILPTVSISGFQDVNKGRLNITSNNALLNSTNLSFFNTSAIIELRGITFTDPEPTVDFNDDDAFASCPSTVCTELTFAGNVFRYNVTQFTQFSSQETPTEILGTFAINSSTTLTANITSNRTGVIINNESVTLDCNGFTIIYGDDGRFNDSIGINASNAPNTTIQNCIILKRNESGLRSYGILLQNSSDSYIDSNTILTNGSEDNDGVRAVSTLTGTNFLVQNVGNPNNGFCANTTAGAGFCSPCLDNADCSVLDQDGCTDGDFLRTDTIQHFNISSGTVVTGGTIKVIGGEGIFCDINGVNIASFGTNNNCGTLFQASIPANRFSTTIENNLTCSVQGWGTDEDNGFRLSEFSYSTELEASSNAIISNNTIIADGGNLSDGIYLEIVNSSVLNNTITTQGIVVGHGINLPTSAIENNVTLNVINATANVSDAIRLEKNSLNVLRNNSVDATGAGIHLDQALNNFINRSIIATSLTGTSLFIAEIEGTINYTQQLNITEATRLARVVNITRNNTFVNTSDVNGSQLNASAVLNLFNLQLGQGQGGNALVDFDDDDSFEGCFGPQCTDLSYNQTGGILKYNVSSFTTYSGAPVSDCDRLDLPFNQSEATFELLNNVTGLNGCMDIVGDNITFDCNGFPIFYDSSGLGAAFGIDVSGSNVTVQNCRIVDVSATGNNSGGINITNVTSGVFVNNTIYTNTTSSANGIIASEINGNLLIQNNTVYGESGGAGGISGFITGIEITSGSNITIEHNNITITKHTGSSEGIFLRTNAFVNNITISNNSIRVNGSSFDNAGVHLEAFGVASNKNFTNITIINNTIFVNGSFGNDGVNVETAASSGGDGIHIILNTIVASGSSSDNDGVVLTFRIGNSSVRENFINASGASSGNDGITLNQVYDSNVTNNTIVTGFTTGNNAGQNDGIQMTTTFFSKIWSNTILTNGSDGSNNGIFLSGNVLNNSIENNTITTGARDTVDDSNIGIFLEVTSAGSPVAWNNITNNTINTTGDDFNHGIAISTEFNADSVYENIIRLNRIHTRGKSNNYGISFTDFSYRNNATNNSIITNGTSGNNYGIDMDSDFSPELTFNNVAEWNNITIAPGFGSNNYGINIEDSGTDDNWVLFNTITTRGNDTNHGIFLDNVDNTTVLRNNITLRGNGSNVGIWVEDGNLNNLTGNRIVKTPTTSNYSHAILIQNTAGRNYISFHNLTTIDEASYGLVLRNSNNTIIESVELRSPVRWMNLTNSFNNFTNFTFFRLNASVQFGFVQSDGSYDITNTTVNMTNNFVRINSTNVTFLNSSAIVTFGELSFIDPVPFVDREDDGTFVTCWPGDCDEINYVNSAFAYNASTFTSYSSQEGNINLSTAKLDSIDPVNQSDFLNYSIQINNTGNTEAINVTVIETYPEQVIFLSASPSPDAGTNNTFSLGNISPQVNFTLNISVFVINVTINGTIINNTANISYTNATNHTNNISLTENTTVIAPVLENVTTVVVTKGDNPDPVDSGAQLNYSITVSVSGNNASNVTLNDTYPSGVFFVSGSPTPLSGTNNTFILGNLSSGESVVVNITVEVTASSGTLTNNVNVTFNNATGGLLSAVDSETTTISSPAAAPAAGGGSGGRGNIIVREPQVEAPAVCLENWACEGWSSCQNGVQTRLCIDLNRCNSTQYLPALQRNCEPSPARTSMLVLEPLQPAVDLFKASLWPIVFIIIGVVLVTFSLWTISQYKGQPRPPRTPKALTPPRRPVIPFVLPKRSPKQEFYGKLDDIDKKLSDVDKHPPKVKVAPVKRSKLEMPKVKEVKTPKSNLADSLVVPAPPPKRERRGLFTALFTPRAKPKIAPLKPIKIRPVKAAPIKISKETVKFKKKMSSFDKELDKLDRKLKKKK